MCIAFPGKILSISEERFAVVDIGGALCEVCLDLVDGEARPGDYVICHAGYAMHRVDEDLARGKLALLKEITDHEIY